MAKAVIAIITLVMLGVWGWMAWGEYDAGPRDAAIHTTPYRDAQGFVGFLAGLDPIIVTDLPDGGFFVSTIDFAWEEGRANLYIALGVIVALSATLFFAVTGGSGTIFSVMITSRVSFFAAATNMVFGLVSVGFAAWTAIVLSGLDLSIGVYAMLLHSAILIVASSSAMRQMPGLVRGRRDPMIGVLKSLLVLAIVNGGLAPVGVMPQFAIAGFSGFYWLTGLCLLSLLFIGLTRSNYEYD
ncbi:MAG: hypothetical protein WD716_13300 [Fimbriimonadaceae bacterium]